MVLLREGLKGWIAQGRKGPPGEVGAGTVMPVCGRRLPGHATRSGVVANDAGLVPRGLL